MQGGIGYTKELKEYVIEKSNEAEIVKEQKENPEKNVFSGLDFPREGENTEFDINSLTIEQRMQMSRLSAEKIAALMNTYKENANATYDGNLEKLGAVDINVPTSISIFPKDFDAKSKIQDAIEAYNKMQEDNGKEENTISYTDIVGTMISSVSKIVDIISYVLIACCYITNRIFNNDCNYNVHISIRNNKKNRYIKSHSNIKERYNKNIQCRNNNRRVNCRSNPFKNSK